MSLANRTLIMKINIKNLGKLLLQDNIDNLSTFWLEIKKWIYNKTVRQKFEAVQREQIVSNVKMIDVVEPALLEGTMDLKVVVECSLSLTELNLTKRGNEDFNNAQRETNK